MSNLDIVSFIDLLEPSNLDTTELSDILWLAKYMKTDNRYYIPEEKVKEPPQQDEIDKKESKPKEETKNPVSKEKQTRTIEESSDDNVSLSVNNNNQETSKAINIAHKGYFDDSQKISRYLIDFKDISFSKRKKLFDEMKTINYKADTGILNPFFKAKKQKLYTLYIFIDYSSSMKVWKEMISEYSKLLSNSGIFKSIKHVYINSHNDKTIFYKDKKFNKVFSPKEITNFHNNKLIFVLTDMLSKGWRNGDTLEVFAKLYKSIPLYVVQMLPYRLWRTSALKKASITTFNSTQRYPVGDSYNSEIDYLLKSLDINGSENLKLPIVSFDLAYLKVIGKTLRAKEDNKIDGAVFNLENIQENEPTTKTKTLSGQEKVEYFFANASPKAQELAKCLSAVQFNLPIMRMIQEKVLKESSNIYIAEVINSGLVNSSTNILEFNDDVCDVLYKLLGRERALEIAYKNSDYIQENLGAKFGFKAYLSGEVDLEHIDLSKNDKKFASISCRILKSMGGEYAKLAGCVRKKKKIIDVVVPDSKRFMMGSTDGKDREKPVHEVIFNYDFEISPYPVTVGEFRVFVEDVSYKTEAELLGGAYVFNGDSFNNQKDAYWDNPYLPQTEDSPVVCVSWNDVNAYIEWLNGKTGEKYRLPTEAEWEYTCRAGTNTRWSFGDNRKELGKHAWYSDNSDSRTHHVGEKIKNKKLPNQWGLYDMHGNIWEWCQDNFVRSYYETPRDGSENIEYERKPMSLHAKVARGGSWDSSVRTTRSSYRWFDEPSSRSYLLGFRLARSLDKGDKIGTVTSMKEDSSENEYVKDYDHQLDKNKLNKKNIEEKKSFISIVKRNGKVESLDVDTIQKYTYSDIKDLEDIKKRKEKQQEHLNKLRNSKKKKKD